MQSRTLLFKFTHSASSSEEAPTSESEETVVETHAPAKVDADALLRVEQSIAAQQAIGLPPPYDLLKTRVRGSLMFSRAYAMFPSFNHLNFWSLVCHTQSIQL
jgi:hypothetical protein